VTTEQLDESRQQTSLEKANAAADEVKLCIADDGPGIGADELDVFERGEETDLAHGSGLGLWLVS